MKKIIVISLGLSLLFNFGQCFFIKTRSPAPFLKDYGHRCFAVKDSFSHDLVLKILSGNDIEESFTFDIGSTTQTVLEDQETVIISHKNPNFTPNALVITAKDPKSAAEEASKLLKYSGYEAEVIQGVDGDIEGKFFFLESEAFRDWVLGFRLHATEMGMPPNKRKITKD